MEGKPRGSWWGFAGTRVIDTPLVVGIVLIAAGFMSLRWLPEYLVFTLGLVIGAWVWMQRSVAMVKRIRRTWRPVPRDAILSLDIAPSGADGMQLHLDVKRDLTEEELNRLGMAMTEATFAVFHQNQTPGSTPTGFSGPN